MNNSKKDINIFEHLKMKLSFNHIVLLHKSKNFYRINN